MDRGSRPEGHGQAGHGQVLVSDTALEVATDAVQICRGVGYLKSGPVEKLTRDTKLLQIDEGTNQIQRMVIARQLGKS